MKCILVGLGSAGFSWYKRLRDRGLLAAVVERDSSTQAKIGDDGIPFYTSLEKALDEVQADFLVNVTSPMAHTAVNHAAFDRKLPVLCEKPISFDYSESIEVVTRAQRENIPFMIAENYRRLPYVRKLKQVLDEGEIGQISSMEIRFYRYHQVQRNYTVSVLDDIGVHHFDMIRYLTGKEAKIVQAKLFNPIGGWQEEGAVISTYSFLEMDGGITVSYAASIASRAPETVWCGDWRIDGTVGAVELIGKEIRVTRNGETRVIDDMTGIDESDTLDEFLASLRENRESESSGADYLKTQCMVHYAKLASSQGQTMEIIMPDITKG